MKLIRIFLEVIGWLQIALGSTLIAGIISIFIYLKWNNETGKAVSLIVLCVGFTIGAIWATRIWIKHGTIAWLSKIRKIS